jgi:tetratricopeptide (TPR) repeat protein
VDDRRLSDAEIETFRRWVDTGVPEGPSSPAIDARASGWTLGAPDLVLTMPEAYVLHPQDSDLFRNFVFPIGGAASGYVRAVEFRPGDTRAIHHAVITVDRSRASRRKDGTDGSPGYAGMFTQGAQSPDGHFLGWTPGRGPIVSPQELPWRLDRGSDIVVQLHLPPVDKPQRIAPEIGIYFTDTPPASTPVMMRIGSKAIDIPAGATGHVTTDQFTLPVDVTLLSIYPHAHYLAHRMQAGALLPNGQLVTLLDVPQWDFHWQQDYRYAAPVFLPRGTIVRMRYTYDNPAPAPQSAAHGVHGASAAPHAGGRVLYGPNSHDEMGDLWLQVVPRSVADGKTLRRALDEHETAVNITGGELLVAQAPNDVAHYVFLGNAYIDAGRVHDAVALLTRGIQLAPRSADAHNALGTALFLSDRLDEALRHLREAATLDPEDERLQFNLAGAFVAVDRLTEGAAAFRRAVAINADFAEAHNNLGVLMQSAGRMNDAVAHFREAVRSNPHYADAHSNLGGALAAQGRFREALAPLRRAVELDPDHMAARRNLAMLLEPGMASPLR